MPIYFSLGRMGNPGKPQEKKKLYARAQAQEVVTLDEIAEQAAWGTTLTAGDIKNVICSMGEKSADHLSNGEIVNLGGLGKIQVQVSSKGAATREEFTFRNIIKVNFRFRPGKLLRSALHDLTFKRVVAVKYMEEAKRKEREQDQSQTENP